MYVSTVTRIIVKRVYLIRKWLTLSLENDTNDQTIDTQDTSHDNGNEASDNQVRTKNTSSGKTDTSLGSTISGTKT